MNNKIAQIRSLIDQAKQHDSSAALLPGLIAARVNHLHDAIKLPEEKAANLLNEFAIRYINQVPEFIEAITDITRDSGIFDGVAPLLHIACDYFLAPPDMIGYRNTLASLLQEAYLAHRLLEEINDRFIGYCGIPLAPMDMTRANVIAHELIGEPYANELDQAVLFSAELLLNQYSFAGDSFRNYIILHQNKGWSRELERWPCLTENLAIVLDFGGPEKKSLH